MKTHEIIVGNVGSVYYGENATSAKRAYGTYVRDSKMGRGRASHVSITWLIDGEIYKEFFRWTRDEDE